MGWIRGSDFALLPKCRLFYLFIYLMFYGSTFITNSLDRYGGIVIFFFLNQKLAIHFFSMLVYFLGKKSYFILNVLGVFTYQRNKHNLFESGKLL